MFQTLFASRSVTAPAIWGKLPGHADFVRSGMRHGESEGWQPWLAQLTSAGGGAADGVRRCVLPVTFVLPPKTLAFAPQSFIIGVITPSSDKVGRDHALLVYQLASPSWAEHHFQAQAEHPRDWLFWLARAVARHTRVQGDPHIQALERTVDALWRIHAPAWRDPDDAGPARDQASEAELHRLAGADAADDPALALRGVRHLPWADWPQAVLRLRAHGVFWQQDPRGGFVSATNELTTLWSGQP